MSTALKERIEKEVLPKPSLAPPRRTMAPWLWAAAAVALAIAAFLGFRAWSNSREPAVTPQPVTDEQIELNAQADAMIGAWVAYDWPTLADVYADAAVFTDQRGTVHTGLDEIVLHVAQLDNRGVELTRLGDAARYGDITTVLVEFDEAGTISRGLFVSRYTGDEITAQQLIAVPLAGTTLLRPWAGDLLTAEVAVSSLRPWSVIAPAVGTADALARPWAN